MKIQLVSDQPPVSPRARVLHNACPLCAGESLRALRDVEASSASRLPVEWESHWSWQGCETCGHLFTAGYPDAQAFEALHAGPRAETCPRPDQDLVRRESGELVHRVALLRGTLNGTWLDVDCGRGALLTCAAEFGYEALGIDRRATAVADLTAQGYSAQVASIEDVEGQDLFDVISFYDSFDTQVFPAPVLQAVGRLLRPGGILSISVPNVDSLAWRQWDEAGSNPYWCDPERFHNFSREHLYWLLRRNGFEPCDFMVSAGLPAGMEVCATFTSEVE